MVGNPRLIVTLVRTRGDIRRLITRQGLGDLDRLLGLLGSTRSALGLREEGLDPGLVDEVDGATESAGQEEVKENAGGHQYFIQGNKNVDNLHLGVKDAGRGLNDASQTTVGLNLEDLVLLIADDGHQANGDILRLHVQYEGVRQSPGLSRSNVYVVAHGRQVTQDTSGWGRILRERLGSRQRSTNKDNVDWALLIVYNLNDCPGGVAIDNLDAKG